MKLARRKTCEHCGRGKNLEQHRVQKGTRMVSVWLHPKCLGKFRREHEAPVTIRIPYMNEETNPIHTLRKRDVFVVREWRAPRMRGNTKVAGEVVLDFQKGIRIDGNPE